MEKCVLRAALLCVVLLAVGALDVSIEKKEYEFARGDNITLPCVFKTKLSPPPFVMISWSVEGSQPGAEEMLILTHYYPNKITDIKLMYEGRASIDVNIPKGKANLLLKQITLADNKVYECRVQIPGDDEGRSKDTANLIVLVAPSTPVCGIQGKAQYGQNINLTCHSEEGSPPPQYSWDSRDVRNMPRQKDPRTVYRGGILSLYNISKETSGFYICTSKNKIRSASCNITLAVMPPSANIGATAGIIAGVAAALVILIVTIYCCCCRKKEEEKEKYAMGVREERYTDNEPERQESTRSYEASEVRSSSDPRDNYEDKSDYDRRRDYDDRQSDYDDHRSDYDDRDRRRDRYEDNRRYEDDRRYQDDRRYEDDRNDRRDRDYADDRYDEPYDSRSRSPANKPKDYEV